MCAVVKPAAEEMGFPKCIEGLTDKFVLLDQVTKRIEMAFEEVQKIQTYLAMDSDSTKMTIEATLTQMVAEVNAKFSKTEEHLRATKEADANGAGGAGGAGGAFDGYINEVTLKDHATQLSQLQQTMADQGKDNESTQSMVQDIFVKVQELDEKDCHCIHVTKLVTDMEGVQFRLGSIAKMAKESSNINEFWNKM